MRRVSKLAVGIVVVAGIGRIGAAQGPAEPKKPAPPPIVVSIDKVKPDATIDLAGDRRLAVAEDALWVSARAAGTVSRIDTKTNKVTQTIPTGNEPCAGFASGLGNLWVALCKAPGVARIDTKTNAVSATVKTAVAGTRRSIVIGNASAWVLTDGKGVVARIDPATNATVAEIYTQSGANAIAFGQGGLWILNGTKNTVTRVNPFTNVEVETITVGKNPINLVIGEGAVWTLNSGDATVSRIDAQTNKVAETIKLTVHAPLSADADIAAGEGSIWVSAPAPAGAAPATVAPFAGAPLIRIDPRANAVVQIFTGLGGGPLVTGSSSLWFVATPKVVWRLDPKRVEATR